MVSEWSHGTEHERALVIDPVRDPRWAELVTTSGRAGVFHHPAWLEVLRDVYRYPVEAWCLKEADGTLTAGLPVATVRSRLTGTRLVAVPFSDRCEAIHRVDADEPAHALAAAVTSEQRRRGLGLEIHGAAPESAMAWPGERFLQHLIPLDEGAEAVLAGVHRSKRKAVRRALAQGVAVVRRTDCAAVSAFFRLHVLTRRRLGSPTQPSRFFHRLLGLFDQGMGFVLLAMCDERPVAAQLYLQLGDVLTCKYSASDPRWLGLRANPMLHMEAIRLGAESGCRVLDLGRTELDNVGLRDYKRQLRSVELPLQYAWLGKAAPKESVRAVSRLQKAAIRRSPPAFGRVVGARLYRHFG